MSTIMHVDAASNTEDRPGLKRSNSINLASVFRAPQEEEDEIHSFSPQHQTVCSGKKSAHRRRNSLNVASLSRNYQDDKDSSFNLFIIPTSPSSNNSVVVDNTTIQQHICYVPRTKNDEEMGLMDDEDTTIPQVQFNLRQRPVTFGAYYDRHNNEMIPELVQVETTVDSTTRQEQQQPKTPPHSAAHTFVQRLLINLTKAHPMTQITCTLVSCILMYAVVNRQPHLDTSLATMMLVTLCGATFPHVITAVACGVYAGSVNTETIGGRFVWVVLLGCITAITWQLISTFNVMLGFSGRLGATAFLAMNITALIIFSVDPSTSFQSYGSSQKLWDDVLSLEQALVTVVATVFISSSAGYFRLIATIPVNPVLVPSAWALCCMLLVSITEYQYSDNILEGFAVGSYVAMASEARVSTFRSFAIVGLIAGMWNIFLQPFFLGFGGKAGFTAMMGYSTYLVFNTIYNKVCNSATKWKLDK